MATKNKNTEENTLYMHMVHPEAQKLMESPDYQTRQVYHTLKSYLEIFEAVKQRQIDEWTIPELTPVIEGEMHGLTHHAVIPLLKNYEVHFKGDLEKAKNTLLKKLNTSLTTTEVHALAEFAANALITLHTIELEAAKVIKGKLPKGISINLAADLKKPIQPPTVEVKIPVPEPRIPLDPKIPIPYPKTPLDPKIPLPDPKIPIPIPKPEIKIHGPYVIKDLEIKLAEVERIRKSLPKNATKAEKKAAANAEQQIKNLLKAAKRAEPKATKKAVVKKATVKKATKKKK